MNTTNTRDDSCNGDYYEYEGRRNARGDRCDDDDYQRGDLGEYYYSDCQDEDNDHDNAYGCKCTK